MTSDHVFVNMVYCVKLVRRVPFEVEISVGQCGVFSLKEALLVPVQQAVLILAYDKALRTTPLDHGPQNISKS